MNQTAQTHIIAERLEKLPAITLESGSHKDFASGMCAMEAAAWIAGEKHSDSPECVCPVIGAFMRSWNDGLGDDARLVCGSRLG